MSNFEKFAKKIQCGFENQNPDPTFAASSLSYYTYQERQRDMAR